MKLAYPFVIQNVVKDLVYINLYSQILRQAQDDRAK